LRIDMRYACIAAWLGLACAAGGPGAPAPGTSQAWGSVRLVPREGVTPGGAGGGSYGDRRLRDVVFVDYTRPGFAVVYAEAASAPGGELAFSIQDWRVSTRIEPENGAVGAAGRVVVRNDSVDPHLVSYPAADLVRRLEPGEQLAVPVPRAGEQAVFLLDEGASATFFAAPGPFAVVSATGSFELAGLEPGPRRLRVWHPRFPTAAADVVLEPDGRHQVDFELGIGRGEHGAH
jgi:hypothetical protein